MLLWAERGGLFLCMWKCRLFHSHYSIFIDYFQHYSFHFMCQNIFSWLQRLQSSQPAECSARCRSLASRYFSSFHWIASLNISLQVTSLIFSELRARLHFTHWLLRIAIAVIAASRHITPFRQPAAIAEPFRDFQRAISLLLSLSYAIRHFHYILAPCH